MYLDLINQYVNIIINTITCKYFLQSMSVHISVFEYLVRRNTHPL